MRSRRRLFTLIAVVALVVIYLSVQQASKRETLPDAEEAERAYKELIDGTASSVASSTTDKNNEPSKASDEYIDNNLAAVKTQEKPVTYSENVTPGKIDEENVAATPKTNGSWAGWRNLATLFTFGDSWTSMEFKLDGAQPSLANPIGNPTFPGDISSIGPNWVGFLTATYNATPFLTYNLGHGAATVSRPFLDPVFPLTYTFEEQVRDKFVRQYAEKVDLDDDAERPAEEGHWNPRTTLFAIWVGVVDIALYVRDGVEVDVLDAWFEHYASIVENVRSSYKTHTDTKAPN